MSLRQIAKHLGITPAYLSYMVNGKRPWRQDLYERYCALVSGAAVNTFVNSGTRGAPKLGQFGIVVGGTGLEPVTSAMSTRRSNQLS